VGRKLGVQGGFIGGSSIIIPQIPYSPLTPTTTLQHLGCLNSNDFSYIFQFLQQWSQIPLGITSNFKILPSSGRLRPPDPLPQALPQDPTGGPSPQPPYRLALAMDPHFQTPGFAPVSVASVLLSLPHTFAF